MFFLLGRHKHAGSADGYRLRLVPRDREDVKGVRVISREGVAALNPQRVAHSREIDCGLNGCWRDKCQGLNFRLRHFARAALAMTGVFL